MKLGEAYVLIISLYLHAKDESWYTHRKDASDSLLQRALERVSQWGGPAIIAGDLNQAPQRSSNSTCPLISWCVVCNVDLLMFPQC